MQDTQIAEIIKLKPYSLKFFDEINLNAWVVGMPVK